MSPDFSRQPPIIKGALVSTGSGSRGPAIDQNTNIFVFQYNPDKLIRMFSYPDHEASTDEEKARYVQGPPIQFINLTLELDVTDQLEEPEQHQETVENGLHPSLAALESIFAGESALFLWGSKRALPVRLTSLKVCEEAFDQNLNPIRAKIDLCMRVLERSELKEDSLGYYIYANQLILKGSLALLYRQSFLDRAHFERISDDIRQYLAKEKS